MRSSKKQIMTDTSMASILEANAVRTLQKNEENVPTEAEQVLAAEAAICDRRLHVNDQGFLTSNSSVPSKRSK
jgi:hypothetical protein